uniref:Late embryogenesis abundant protein n=1 Tax=Mesocestoides corti TaxID=53468 RepID=A0A5K3FYA8_MESCO
MDFTMPHVRLLGEVRVSKIGGVSRACTTTTKKTASEAIPSYVFNACFNVTDVAIDLPKQCLSISIGLARFDVSLQISESSNIAPRLTVSIPVWKDINVKGPRLKSTLVQTAVKSRTAVQLTLQSAANAALQTIKFADLLKWAGL